MRKTCDKVEALEIEEDVLKLAQEVLSPTEVSLAEQLSTALVGTKSEKEFAVLKLRILVGNKPKRPVSYLNYELKYLPRRTRDSTRYLGDYIDKLVKSLAVEKTGNSKCAEVSLNGNIKKLKGKVDEQLLARLFDFNFAMYTPAKHYMKQFKERRHRFTSKEVVYFAFITMKLAEQITTISPLAKEVSEDTANDWA